MMNQVKSQIVIDAPVEQVWEILADFGEVYRWAPSVTKSYSTSDDNSGPEASRHCDIAGLGASKRKSRSGTKAGASPTAHLVWAPYPIGTALGRSRPKGIRHWCPPTFDTV